MSLIFYEGKYFLKMEIQSMYDFSIVVTCGLGLTTTKQRVGPIYAYLGHILRVRLMGRPIWAAKLFSTSIHVYNLFISICPTLFTP